jgi:2-oxoglutarate dehydrogenase E1 component
MNLEASRKKDLTIITPFMRNEWLGFEVTDVQMLEKVDTSYSKLQHRLLMLFVIYQRTKVYQ